MYTDTVATKEREGPSLLQREKAPHYYRERRPLSTMEMFLLSIPLYPFCVLVKSKDTTGVKSLFHSDNLPSFPPVANP